MKRRLNKEETPAAKKVQTRTAQLQRKIRVLLEQMPDILGTTDLAPQLGVSRQYIHQLIQQGRLRGTRLGHAFIIYKEDLTAFAQNKEPTGRRKRFFSIAQVAAQLDIDVNTVNRLIKVRAYPHHTLASGQIFFSEEEYQFLQSRYQKYRRAR